MAHSSGIDLTYQGNFLPYEILELLLSSGWRINDGGKINLIPLGSNDASNWVTLDINEREDALRILKYKSIASEVVGVTLRWRNNDIGMNTLFLKGNSILFSLIINRKELRNSDFTDISWYLDRLLPPLITNGVKIEEITWNEHV